MLSPSAGVGPCSSCGHCGFPQRLITLSHPLLLPLSTLQPGRGDAGAHHGPSSRGGGEDSGPRSKDREEADHTYTMGGTFYAGPLFRFVNCMLLAHRDCRVEIWCNRLGHCVAARRCRHSGTVSLTLAPHPLLCFINRCLVCRPSLR